MVGSTLWLGRGIQYISDSTMTSKDSNRWNPNSLGSWGAKNQEPCIFFWLLSGSQTWQCKSLFYTVNGGFLKWGYPYIHFNGICWFFPLQTIYFGLPPFMDTPKLLLNVINIYTIIHIIMYIIYIWIFAWFWEFWGAAHQEHGTWVCFSPLKWSFHCRGNPRRPLKRKELSASKPSTTPLGRTAQKNWWQFDETQRNEFLKLTVLALDLFGSQAMVLVLEVHI